MLGLAVAGDTLCVPVVVCDARGRGVLGERQSRSRKPRAGSTGQISRPASIISSCKPRVGLCASMLPGSVFSAPSPFNLYRCESGGEGLPVRRGQKFPVVSVHPRWAPVLLAGAIQRAASITALHRDPSAPKQHLVAILRRSLYRHPLCHISLPRFSCSNGGEGATRRPLRRILEFACASRRSSFRRSSP